MDKQELQQRAKAFALRIVRLYQCLPNTGEASVLGRQLLRCGTSVGANYRAACHAKSRPDFLAKIKICEEEADECEYWLELLADAGILRPSSLAPLLGEARELAAIMAAIAIGTRGASRHSSKS